LTVDSRGRDDYFLDEQVLRGSDFAIRIFGGRGVGVSLRLACRRDGTTGRRMLGEFGDVGFRVLL